MISRMLLGRRLAGMIRAAIFVIAAPFLAGSALAHAGSHGHSAASYSAAAQLSAHASPTILSIVPVAGLQQADLSPSTPEGADMPVIPQSGGCPDACCGSGISCCGAVLTVAPTPVPDERPAKEAVSPAFDDASGMDPEAPRRPPRPLA